MVAGVDRGKGSESHVIRALAVLGWAGEGQLYNKYFAKIFYFWLLKVISSVLSLYSVGLRMGALMDKYITNILHQYFDLKPSTIVALVV